MSDIKKTKAFKPGRHVTSGWGSGLKPPLVCVVIITVAAGAANMLVDQAALLL